MPTSKQIIVPSAGLKAGPQHGGKDLGTVAKGDTLTVTDSEWSHVQITSGAAKGKTGYLLSSAIGDAVVPPATSRLTFRCIDSMKESMDSCRNQLTAAQIAQSVNLMASLNVSHVSVDCHLDYPEYLAAWTNAVRAAGKQPWFRCHWNRWEGSNNTPADMTPDQYLEQLATFIKANLGLFKPGDIFDACPEPENGHYFNTGSKFAKGWSSGAPNASTNEFNKFIVDVKTVSDTALKASGINGVITGIRSTNGWWASHPQALYKATTDILGYVTLDTYPSSDTTDPATAAKARHDDIQAVVNARPGAKLVLGEFGYSNKIDVSDSVQQAVIAAELAEVAKFKEVVGLNYWVGPGTAHSGGYTHIFSGSSGAWKLRPAAATLSKFFGG